MADEDPKTCAHIQLLFSPKNRISKELLIMYKAATKDIKITVFGFTMRYFYKR